MRDSCDKCGEFVWRGATALGIEAPHDSRLPATLALCPDCSSKLAAWLDPPQPSARPQSRNLRPWKPGQSGNPKGRPKGRPRKQPTALAGLTPMMATT